MLPDDVAHDAPEAVRRAQQGDAAAFAELYVAYADGVYRYVRSRVRDHATAEDLTSETFLRAFRRITAFRHQGQDIGAWFTTIARNAVIDHHRALGRRPETLLGRGATLFREQPAGDDVEQQVLDAVAAREVLAVLPNLEPAQRRCITLRFGRQLTRETALAMDSNADAVKQLQHRSVRRLRRALARTCSAAAGAEGRRS
jgi:RNA polymerase sigma-70 factor (ECF subfamily)